jgi:ribonuclease HI
VDGGEIVWECAEYLGVKTNNEAEYTALIRLLEEAVARGLAKLDIRGDSRLVVCQVRGEWKINFPHLRALAERARKLMAGLDARLEWVPRSENKLADALSNKAIDDR